MTAGGRTSRARRGALAAAAPSDERMAGLHAWEPDVVGYDAGGRRSLRIGHLDLSGAVPTFRPHVE